MTQQEEPTIGYMCKVDYEYELGNASGGNTVYPSIADCLDKCKCIDGCGMVEVEVRLVRVISNGTDQ